VTEMGDAADRAGQGATPLATVAARLPLTQFTELITDTPVHFQLLDLGEQLMVWIGCGGARLENLSVAMPTKCEFPAAPRSHSSWRHVLLIPPNNPSRRSLQTETLPAGAVACRHDSMPTVATVLGDGTGTGDGAAMAQRLSKRLGRPVLVSLALPPNATLLQAVVERRLMEALGGAPPAAAADSLPDSASLQAVELI
jgi:hypothetical protein